jgi:hypothetical protein
MFGIISFSSVAAVMLYQVLLGIAVAGSVGGMVFIANSDKTPNR